MSKVQRKSEEIEEPTADVLGVLVLLRRTIELVRGLSAARRKLVLELVDLALRDLHPRPLPAWLFAYQVLSERRRRLISDFIVQQVKLEEGEHTRIH
jgi:hypothetical protein